MKLKKIKKIGTLTALTLILASISNPILASATETETATTTEEQKQKQALVNRMLIYMLLEIRWQYLL